ncbi:hypothetical protein Nepgr_003218 [Nepenthes gracilis]|uniref:Uncharacterized protein n=1 Tax=Nepenthes gracilis TaxID=150966 RepID=A0AAD3XD60_NEPGR|nr:hypothetical protein Nepgr_003218 [Nepenthes gracilis]
MAIELFSSYDTTLPQPLTNENTNCTHLRDASFSSYLDTAERDFLHNLADSIHNNSSPSLPFTRDISAAISLGRNRNLSSASSVLGSQRHFSEQLDDEKMLPKKSSAVRKQARSKEARDRLSRMSYSPALNLKSETSWNSQAALLPSPFRHTSQPKLKKVGGLRLLFNGFQCKGSACYEKRSVLPHQASETCRYQGNGNRNNEEVAKPRQVTVDGARKHPQQPRFQVKGGKQVKKTTREEYFALPIIDTALMAVKIGKGKSKEVPRKSLELFGHRRVGKEDVSLRSDRGVPMMTWDAILNFRNVYPSTTSNGGIIEDVLSDASSDLFEIENLSIPAWQPVLTSRTPDMSSCLTAPTTKYEPGEASIERSVVDLTASAADIYTASDLDGGKQTEKSAIPLESSKTKRSQQSGRLLGCKSQKAVSVAGTARRISEKANSQVQRWPRILAAFPIPSKKLQAGALVKDY